MKKQSWYAYTITSLLAVSALSVNTAAIAIPNVQVVNSVHQVSLAPITVSPYEPDFTIKLWTNPRGGYRWIWIDDRQGLWELRSHHLITKNPQQVPIGPVEEIWNFTATEAAFKKPGPVRPLVFIYEHNGVVVERMTVDIATTCKPTSPAAAEQHQALRNQLSVGKP